MEGEKQREGDGEGGRGADAPISMTYISHYEATRMLREHKTPVCWLLVTVTTNYHIPDITITAFNDMYWLMWTQSQGI